MGKYIRKSVGITARYSFSKFAEEVDRIANEVGRGYSSVKIEKTRRNGVDIGFECSAYIDGYAWVYRESVQECIQAMRECVNRNGSIITQEISK